MSDPIKQGDAATLTWTIDPIPATVTAARVVIRAATPGPMPAPVVSRNGTYSAGQVSITLTAAETAVSGTYRCEVEVTPGPLTFPSSGYDTLRIVPDLG